MNDSRIIEAYECDRCGACCERLIIEVEHEDVLREPKIAESATLLDGRGKLPLVDAQWGLACGSGCPFGSHDADGKHACRIYATRPGVCVSMQAGSEQCVMARSIIGLEPLRPVRREATIGLRIMELARGDNNA